MKTKRGWNGSKLRWCDHCLGWFARPYHQHPNLGPCCPGCMHPWGGHYNPPAKPQKASKGKTSRRKAAKRERVYKRDRYRCVRCLSPENLTLDHIIPKSKGGTDSLKNLQTLCYSCNTRKGDSMEMAA